MATTSFNNQVWVVSGVLFNIASQAGVLAFSECLRRGLRTIDSSFFVDHDSASWIVASIAISSVPGQLLSSVLMETRGRRFTFLLMIAMGITGSLLMYFSTNVGTVLIARISGGMSLGATVTLGPVVIGEYTSPVHRGIFLNLKTVFTCAGSAVVHALSHYFEWKTISLFIFAPMALAFLNVCTWPESPQWLISKNRFEESEKSFYWLRGDNHHSKKEYEALVKAQKAKIIQTDVLTIAEKASNFFYKFTQKTFVKPALVIFFAFLMMEACGRHAFPAFALKFVSHMNKDKSQSFFYTTIMDLIILGSCLLSCVLVKVIKRRTLLFLSAVVSLLLLIVVAVYLYLTSTSVIPDDKPWIPIYIFVVYLLFVNLGCTPIPYTLLGEIFPLEHKSAGTGLAGCFIAVMILFSLKATPVMMDSIQIYGTFTVYAVIMLISLLYLVFALPETKNKTLQEIEEYFRHGKFLEKAREEESKKMIDSKV